jgi:DNA polymerase III subunit delta
MKVKPADADRFASQPGEGLLAVLVYGPDPGLVHERVLALSKAWLGKTATDDPFAVLDLESDELAKDPGRLTDETNSMTLMGGRRVIRLRDADEKVSKAAQQLLNEADPARTDNRVILAAGDLSARSSLRKLFEDAATGAALACYVEDARTLSGVIGQRLQEAGKQAPRELLAQLGERLTGDRALMTRELDKLILYMGDDPALTPEHIAATIGDEADLSLDDAVMAAMRGDIPATDRAMQRLWSQETSPVAILRALQRHLSQLQPMALEVDKGKSAKAVVSSARPPIFFKLQPAFEAQLSIWTPERLSQAMERALETEAQCKETNAPDRALTERAFWALAQLARRGMRRR